MIDVNIRNTKFTITIFGQRTFSRSNGLELYLQIQTVSIFKRTNVNYVSVQIWNQLNNPKVYYC